MGPCIWPSSAPPRGARLIALRTHAHKNVSTTPLFTQSCKRVRNSLKIRNFNSLSFHTHAHSFAVSPLFATHTQNMPGVYVPPALPGSTRQSNSFVVLHFSAISHCEDKVSPTPLFSIKSALFAHSSPASPLFASLAQNNGGVYPPPQIATRHPSGTVAFRGVEDSSPCEAAASVSMAKRSGIREVFLIPESIYEMP